MPPPYSESVYDYVWSDGGDAEDRGAWFAFLEKVDAYRREYPDLRLVHYANFERTQIKLYARRYAMEDNELVTWLLSEDGPLLDLRVLIKSSLILPVTGYGLKNICKDERLVNFQWKLNESGSQWSVVRYHDYLNSCDKADRAKIKAEILQYNMDDVLATAAMEAWLREMFQS
jgi:uncharacterized protein